MNDLINFLNDGPCRSTDLRKKIVETEGITNEAARKRISRFKDPIKRININLPNNEKIFYIENQFGKSLFITHLEEILIQSNTAAGRALIALNSYSGALPIGLFAKASGTALTPSKKHIHCDTVINQLKDNLLINVVDDSRYTKLICNHDKSDIPIHQRSVFEVENIFLPIIKAWLINLGFSSLNTLAIRDENKIPTCGQFAWDIVGPCYTLGIRTEMNNTVQNGFVIGDILLDRVIKLEDLNPFFYKIESLKNQKKMRPILPLFIADSFDPSALEKLRKNGIIVAMPKTILGGDASNLLKSLINFIEKASENIKHKPMEIFDILTRINKIEGAALNLRSVVFDFMLARIYSVQGFNCSFRKKIYTEIGQAEIDVLAERDNEIICIEGKAVAPKNEVKKSDIEDWSNKGLPVIIRWLKRQDNLSGKKKTILFCTSTQFSSDSTDLIDKIQRDQRIKFLKNNDILDMIKEQNQSFLTEIYKEQFQI